MSRLIDVDEAIKSYEKYDSFMGEPLTERDAYLVECVLALFDSRPIAYDVEAVVKELEELRKVYMAKESDLALGMACGLLDAIAIVKRGGRDEG